MAVSKTQAIVRFQNMERHEFLYVNMELRQYNGQFYWYSANYGRTKIGSRTRAALRYARTLWNVNGYTFFLRSI